MPSLRALGQGGRTTHLGCMAEMPPRVHWCWWGSLEGRRAAQISGAGATDWLNSPRGKWQIPEVAQATCVCGPGRADPGTGETRAVAEFL